MAAKTASNPRLLFNDSNRAPSIEERLVHTSATWKASQFLYDKNDGFVYTCASDSVALKYFALQDLDTATGNTTTYKRMMRTHNDDVYELNVYHATASTAVIAEASVGLQYPLYVASNVCYLDVTDVNTPAFEVVEPSWRMSAYMNKSTDTYARVCVKIIAAVVHAVVAG